MIVGKEDGIAGAKASARLHGKLQAAGVPSVRDHGSKGCLATPHTPP